MGALFAYIIKSGICLAAFYLFYKFLLSNETFHKFNRATLLGILFLSLVLPMFNFSFSAAVDVKTFEIPLQFLLAAQYDIVLPQSEATKLTLVHFLLLAYILGAVFFAVRNIFAMLKIYFLIKNSKKQRLENKITLVLHTNNIAPFSWFRYIVICENDFAENGYAIIEHEKAHIAKRHSFDLLLCEMYNTVQWLNPVAWLFKRELQNVHEYQADETVINKGIDTTRYKLMLIQKAVGERLFAMANNFNKNKLKKRIKMMSKQKSNPYSRLKYLYVLPLLAVVVTVFANPQVQHEMNKISAVSINDFIPAGDADSENVYAEENPKHVIVDTHMVIHGDDTINVNLTTIVNESVEKKPLYVILDGEIIDSIDHIDANSIESVSVLKGEAAKKMYGEEAMDGVVVISTKKKGNEDSNSSMTNNRKTVIYGQSIEMNTDTVLKRKYLSFPNGFYYKIHADSICSASGWEKINLDSLQNKLWEKINLDSLQNKLVGEVIKVGTIKRNMNQKKINLDSLQNKLSGEVIKVGTIRRNINQEKINLDSLIRKINLEPSTHILDSLATSDPITVKVSKVNPGAAVRYYLEDGVTYKLSNIFNNLSADSYGVDAIMIIGVDTCIQTSTANDMQKKPLVIVDGNEIESGDLEKINPEEIESISILKDATATKTYGKKGMNGVILITTKKGSVLN